MLLVLLGWMHAWACHPVSQVYQCSSMLTRPPSLPLSLHGRYGLAGINTRASLTMPSVPMTGCVSSTTK